MVRSVYYLHFLARLRYGISFLVGDNESNNIFKLKRGYLNN